MPAASYDVSAGAGNAGVFLAELVDATGGVDDLLLAGIERMAVRAHFDLRSCPTVERVLKVLPQLQVTVISLYSGWIAAFMIYFLLHVLGRAAWFARRHGKKGAQSSPGCALDKVCLRPPAAHGCSGSSEPMIIHNFCG